MKKLIAILMACLLCVSVASAAEWGEGRSPAQPYPGVPEVDLSKTMGYIMLYPRTKVPARTFCDVLEIYLPRDDIRLNKGTLTLYTSDNQVVGTYDFTDGEHVEVRPLTDIELQSLMWGGGSAVTVHLDVSLKFGQKYYVFMDEGCFTASNGNINSLLIGNPEAWMPVLEGDYGVSGLYYSEPEEAPAPTPEPSIEDEDFDASESEASEASADAKSEPAPIVYKVNPEVGDVITFDLVLGGDARSAVVFSDNDSVLFTQTEFKTSSTVTGTVINADLNWGLVFLNSEGDILDVVSLTSARS